jgi:Protein of unknown function (DUF2034)
MPSCIRNSSSLYRYVRTSALRASSAPCPSFLFSRQVWVRRSTTSNRANDKRDAVSTHRPSPVADLDPSQHGQALPHTYTQQFKSRAQIPLSTLIPRAVSSNHHTQETFLQQSQRTGLDPASTVFTGTRYEYLTLTSLRRLGIELVRIGGTGDKGVDLAGFWHLPQWPSEKPLSSGHLSPTSETETDIQGGLRETIKVVVQCKRISATARAAKTLNPNAVRELEGAFRGAPSGWRGTTGADTVMGLLISTRSATKGVVESLKRSERPLGYILLEEVERESPRTETASNDAGLQEEDDGKEIDTDVVLPEAPEELDSTFEDGKVAANDYVLVEGRIKQILWNPKATELGLRGLDVVRRYTTSADPSIQDEVVLMWQPRPIPSAPTE